MRWVLNREQDNIVARLVDDTGIEESEPEVSFFNMMAPLLGCHHPSDAALAGQAVEMPGGLLQARQGNFEDFVVVSCKFTATDLQDIGFDSDFSQLRESSIISASNLNLYAKWHKARLYGPLVKVRWEEIKNEFLALIYEKLCGQNWARAEENFRQSSHSQQMLDTLQSWVARRPSNFGDVLRREYEQLRNGVRQDSSWYADLARRNHVCTDPKLSAFAYNLALEAHLVPEKFSGELDMLLNAVRENPTVLRGARFLQCLSSVSTTI